ncbi:MAG: hypothetical protein JWQ08_1750 [Deinococcus sp.]|nr:hypothetical protein [Deinococcus sp.]
MDALIELTFRALAAVLLNRFGLGLLLVLLALYAAGSGWPAWLAGLSAALGLLVWAAGIWQLWQERRPSGLDRHRP